MREGFTDSASAKKSPLFSLVGLWSNGNVPFRHSTIDSPSDQTSEANEYACRPLTERIPLTVVQRAALRATAGWMHRPQRPERYSFDLA